MRILTGAPTYMLYSSSYTGDQAFSEITAALARGFNVGCDTSGSSIYGIATSHAYEVMSTHVIKDTSGNVV